MEYDSCRVGPQLRSLDRRLFVGPGPDLYEGQIIGEHSRENDLKVNPGKGKKLTNMRSSGADDANRIVPPRLLNLEQALEFCREDECIEVTPSHVRIRKVILDKNGRDRARTKTKNAN